MKDYAESVRPVIWKFPLWSTCPGWLQVLLGGILERVGLLSLSPAQAGERVTFPSPCGLCQRLHLPLA